ncbi:hypothetical protein BDR03DRAFT_963246 [Suillus americanus]|nr:hypothetical protein BDR03DRAFT_963246 [Suillus americanus]
MRIANISLFCPRNCKVRTKLLNFSLHLVDFMLSLPDFHLKFSPTLRKPLCSFSFVTLFYLIEHLQHPLQLWSISATYSLNT